ncbi:MAG: DNA methyltransferase [bacterium]
MTIAGLQFTDDNEYYTPKAILEFLGGGFDYDPSTTVEKAKEFGIKNSSHLGDVVLDPFMGVGSTGIASRRLRRKFIGIELDEHYFNIANERVGDYE